ncbi:hypothetical protein MMC12_008639 [Toensbergia leucococca]|nr:hypothetical protein [Toensbergia leucococca]
MVMTPRPVVTSAMGRTIEIISPELSLEADDCGVVVGLGDDVTVVGDEVARGCASKLKNEAWSDRSCKEALCKALELCGSDSFKLEYAAPSNTILVPRLARAVKIGVAILDVELARVGVDIDVLRIKDIADPSDAIMDSRRAKLLVVGSELVLSGDVVTKLPLTNTTSTAA